MLATRITVPHFSVSSTMNLPKSAGVIDFGTLPTSAKRAVILGSVRPASISLLGFLLVCTADFAVAEGFDPDIKFTRTQTIMQGASHCDFRYKRQKD
jgi:hypothetical protein